MSAKSGHQVNEAMERLCIRMSMVKRSVLGMRLQNNRHSKNVAGADFEYQDDTETGVKKRKLCCKQQ